MKRITTQEALTAFDTKHEGEIKGLYDDSYYKMGCYNGRLMARKTVAKRYGYKIAVEDSE